MADWKQMGDFIDALEAAGVVKVPGELFTWQEFHWEVLATGDCDFCEEPFEMDDSAILLHFPQMKSLASIVVVCSIDCSNQRMRQWADEEGIEEDVMVTLRQALL